VKNVIPELVDPDLYINRELSWLQFNDRVLDQASQDRHPLLERVRFVSISETNLDEFFMTRVAGLKRQLDVGRQKPVPDGMTSEEQLCEIHSRVNTFVDEQRRILADELLPALENAGIRLISYQDLSLQTKQEMCRRFEREMLPILTPLAVDPAHPFPHISNLSLNLLTVIRDGERKLLARVKIPDTLQRLLRISSSEEASSGGPHEEVELVRIEEIIAANLDKLFPGEEVVACHVFQVTRDADLTIQEDEAPDLLQTIEQELDRRRFGRSVRLVVSSKMPEDLRRWLAAHLGVDPDFIYAVKEPIGLADFEELTDLDRPDLLYLPIEPHIPPQLKGEDSMFSAIRQDDILLYHPYDSFSPVVGFVRSAADDPKVLAIKQTLYRSGAESPIIESLAKARDDDTQVAVLVELKARFDEKPNIGWARRLEERGVHVAYGIMGLKTHAKMCLIVRKEGSDLNRYIDLGTGNFNPKTAQIYTDFSYLTDDPDLVTDGSDLFNYLTGHSKQKAFRKLLVAPLTLRDQMLKLISQEQERAEDGQPTRILAKMNQLTDPQIIEALYRASQASVPVDLIVRGICRLRPGVPAISENIRVVSLVGRFLEHARAYVFGVEDSAEFYLGSADLMERNLDRRIEQLFPLPKGKNREKVQRILELQLADTANSWELNADGTYTRLHPQEGEEALDSQTLLLEEPF
jgi:polyphosphate kinase